MLAFLDDIHMVTRPGRVGAVYVCLGDELQTRASIRIHGGKTKIWNQAGERLLTCYVLERQQKNPRARVWRGSEVPTAQQGIKVLGTPPGHPDFVRHRLRDVSEEHERFLTRIPSSEMCSPHGFFCCTVPRHERISCSELSGLKLWRKCAIRTRCSTFWASWADCISVVDARHPRLLHNWWFSWRCIQPPLGQRLPQPVL